MPSDTPALTVDAQRTFETKLRKAIEIALSKYQTVQVPDSLFSKKQLIPSCAARGRATLQQPRESESEQRSAQSTALNRLDKKAQSEAQQSPSQSHVHSQMHSPTSPSQG